MEEEEGARAVVENGALGADVGGDRDQESERAADAVAGSEATAEPQHKEAWAAVSRLAQQIPGFKVHAGPACPSEDAQQRPADLSRGSSRTSARERSTSPARWTKGSLIEHLEPKYADACVEKMSVVEFSQGENIVDQGSVGTTMVRVSWSVRAAVRSFTFVTFLFTTSAFSMSMQSCSLTDFMCRICSISWIRATRRPMSTTKP